MRSWWSTRVCRANRHGRLHAEGCLGDHVPLGGGKGTGIGTSLMRALRLGVPKALVSTGASGDTRRYMGSKDVIMFPCVTDIVSLI